MNLQAYKTFLQETKVEQKLLSSQKDKLIEATENLKAEGGYLLEAQDVINAVGILAQAEFQEVVECLVTQALQYIFGPSYSFRITNKIVRNQSESYFHVVIDDVEYSLEDELGGGVLDVVSFALRVVFWVINVEKTEPIMFFDEPAKFVSKDKREFLGKMLKGMSELLGLQIIMVTHDEIMEEISDRSFKVSMENGVSSVERIK